MIDDLFIFKANEELTQLNMFQDTIRRKVGL